MSLGLWIAAIFLFLFVVTVILQKRALVKKAAQDVLQAEQNAAAVLKLHQQQQAAPQPAAPQPAAPQK